VAAADGAVEGRSPRGRRSPLIFRHALVPLRSISARAEEPSERCGGRRWCRVDLRAGGGAEDFSPVDYFDEGRSPRGRRSRERGRRIGKRRGSISARAEEPSRLARRRSCAWVDLRAGGGATPGDQQLNEDVGRSPRGRRSHTCSNSVDPLSGSISARAEEPPQERRLSALQTVDLRAGGGAARIDWIPLFMAGRSPRGRRSRIVARITLVGRGSISARAEEPVIYGRPRSTRKVDLRAGGGAPSFGLSSFTP